MTHGQILTAVWGPAHKDDTQYLRVFVGQLRDKIERDPWQPTIIRTESGVGYRFAESVRLHPALPQRRGFAVSRYAAPTPIGQETPVPPRPQ